MKTVVVWLAGALFASMTLAAGNGPTMEERARVKYGRTATKTVAAHCPGCTVHGTAVPERAAWAHVKFGRPLPVQRVAPTCCAHGE